MTAAAIIALVVCSVINRTLGMRVTEVLPHHSLADDLAVESIDLVTIAMEVEDLFGIEVTDDEVPALATVADWIALVERKTAERIA
ncbi:MAG: hypothetical protein IT472_08975 [Thermomonas sp.]|uniref:phosphopantetheine-binding protein n=1 Tax=Thermomonas sp. TaxID=1971895 RepID=UPI00262AC74F|nr:phosphopantetheine-binding protein [Thermomonas sp.]MCC7097298.1 hypothetical protein [Thermomonas sp.]